MKINNIQDVVVNSKNTVVFVSGVTGQDGSHMVDYLLKNTDCQIVGGARLLSNENHINLEHIKNEPRFQLVNFDLTDSHSVYKIVEQIQPDYFINFAAQSFVHGSWDVARQTWNANSTAVLDILESIKQIKPTCRFYNAGSSEEFGNVLYSPQDEKHPARPRSPYGASKSAARTIVKVYRDSYGLYAVQGWLFNHEGTRRGEKFVTRKITKGVARIKNELRLFTCNPIELGNIDAKRDWSDAEDMVDAVWRMLNQDKYSRCLRWPDNTDWSDTKNVARLFKDAILPFVQDFVCSNNETHTIREFIEIAFEEAKFYDSWPNNDGNAKFYWEGSGVDEKYIYEGFEGKHVVVKINPEFYRPAEVEILWGNSSKIRDELGWSPKTDFRSLIKKMVVNDLLLTKE